MKQTLHALLILACLFGYVSGQIVTEEFQQGLLPLVAYSGATDAMISQDNPNTNYGSDNELTVDGENTHLGPNGDSWVLMRFDISSIPTGVTVTNVELILDVTNTSPGTYNILPLNRNWTEMGATWNRFNGVTNWSTAGANHNPNDFTNTTLATTPTGGPLGLRTITFNAAGRTQIQNWINAPASNFGFIMRNAGNTDGFDFYTKEFGTANRRPRLRITYDIPLPVRILSLSGLETMGGIRIDGLVETDGVNGISCFLERSVSGLIDFQTIAGIDLSEGSDFVFTDAGLRAGGYLYRLRLVESDGKISYSHSIEVQLSQDKGQEWMFYFPHERSVVLHADHVGEYYKVVDSKGVTVLAGFMEFTSQGIHFEEMPAGVYLVCLGAHVRRIFVGN